MKVLLFLFFLLPALTQAQTPAPETRRYAIEVAGLRVGTMTATRQLPTPANPETISTLTSDVQVDILFYHLVIYYKVTNYVRADGQLRLSTVNARTNQGNFSSRTEWKEDHYDIVADQYKHRYRATETRPIRYTVTDMFFGEPANQPRAFAEYFGDFFVVKPGKAGRYQATRAGREDEYQYKDGQLMTLIKKNPLKNFIIRVL
ncbi:DUF6134 family protein [Hymenobacter actinosclerus]|uniref:Uncharacterized protein n=1 Tax=Hymenobacter actinosclerus TaxID=82805 RepID=A0A1I0ES65_9BACT|nr:DUF6134 family protein [Hymenobacter actinosclerus]SET48262.1 hypothetical protein SAMN04487998_1974 [Hymenobacter actinosclerus]